MLHFTTLARLQNRLQADSIKICWCLIVYIKAKRKQYVQLWHSGQSEAGSKCLLSNENFSVLLDCQEAKNADDIDEFLRKKTFDKRCNSEFSWVSVLMWHVSMKADSKQSPKNTGSLGNETFSYHIMDVIACPQNKETVKWKFR